MFSQILIPLDGTPESNVALPVGRALAGATGAALTLLRVMPRAEDAESITTAQQRLERVAHELRGAGFQVKVVVTVGDPAMQILHTQRAEGVDLIVMRTHGRAALERALFGSVADGVLSATEVPVVLVRPGGRRLRRVSSMLVPVDSSPGGAVALATAAAVAQKTGASVRLLEVVVPIPAYLYATEPYAGLELVDPAWDDDARTIAQSYLEHVAGRLRARGLKVEYEVRTVSSIVDAITAAADERAADLIVMSTHALRGPARAVLGSISDGVVRTAHCPVLVVRRVPPAPRQVSSDPIAQTASEPDLVPLGT